MAIEIRELVIKTTVDNQKSTEQQSQSTDKQDNQSIINTCVAEVLKILRREKER